MSRAIGLGDRPLKVAVAGAGACFDSHVAYCHSPFHSQRSDRATGKFDRMACSACCANFAYHRQHQVLGSDTLTEYAFHQHLHGAGFFHQQALSRHHMLNLRRANAKRQQVHENVIQPPRSPKLNGAVERGNRTHAEEFWEVTDVEVTVAALRPALCAWETTYDHIRPHQALGYLTPLEYLASVGIDV